MHVYAARRLATAIVTFFGITLATFVLVHSAPGDPIAFFVGKSGMHVSQAALAAIRAEHHLDEPLLTQYGYWIRDVVTFDFGRSIVDREPVTAQLARKLPNTLLINVLAFLLAVAAGLPAGIWSAVRSGTRREQAVGVLLFLLYSLPTFWVALLLMQWFAVKLEWLPLFGMRSDGWAEMTAGARFLDALEHLVLPVVTLAYAQIAIFARFSKSAVAEVITADFITAARARGASGTAILWKHALRNALVPLVTLLGISIPYLFSGSVIVEQIFQWDGIGLLYLQAILRRDYPVVMALTVVTAVVTLLANLGADLLYGVVDPRVSLEERHDH